MSINNDDDNLDLDLDLDLDLETFYLPKGTAEVRLPKIGTVEAWIRVKKCMDAMLETSEVKKSDQ